MNHVLTPFSRWRNFPRLRDMLRSQGVHWHLLLDDYMPQMQSSESWIHFHHLPTPPYGFFVGHWFYNMFLDHVPLNPDDHYNLITDDDFFEPGMFDKIRSRSEGVVVTSMNRGRWGVLWADPSHVRVGSMGLEQMHIRGDILKYYRLNGFYEADGFMIEQLWRDRPADFKFVPEAHCYFNYLPPGSDVLW